MAGDRQGAGGLTGERRRAPDRRETTAVGGRGAYRTTASIRAKTLVVAVLAVLAMGTGVPAQDREDAITAGAARDIVERVAATVAAEYFDPAGASRVASRLREESSLRRYSAVVTKRELASALTRDLFDATHDKHLVVSMRAPASSVASEPRDVRGRRENFGVREAAILAGNVGYLNLSSFYRADEARDALAAAMRLLARADALIVDMRENGGGAPDTVALLAAYLFDVPGKPLFQIVPRSGDSQLYTTPIQGVDLRDGTRPVYVLTSARTFSAGEGCAFILQEERRAVVVGEQTAGAANPGRAYPAGDDFEITVPNGQVRTSTSQRNWEGTGVTPDVPVPAARAQTKAHELALRALIARTPAGAWRSTLEREAARLANTPQSAAGPSQADSAARSPSIAPELKPRRLSQNPLITVTSSATLGGNVNGPTIIRVPDWAEHPLGKYYMYFANHMGEFIRLAYADSVSGPWTIYEPGVLHVKDSAFFREQPDPPETLDDFYTHVASPEILIDRERKRFVMWVHGWFTNGERWPANPADARAWARQKGYGQFTQPAESNDGVHFTVQPALTKTSYIRVFQRGAYVYGVSRLGLVSRAGNPLASFEPGPNLFRDTAYANRVRHVALVQRGDRLHVFFTGIGDAPERVLVSTVDLTPDWTTWRASAPVEVLRPETTYECTDLPNVPSEAGDINEPARQIRDPFVFEDEGRAYLFYSTCGEQGIAAAEIPLI